MGTKQTAHILVIEDDSHIAEGLRLNLSLQGYAVTVATDGVTGIQKWRELRPDLIVLDIMMPVMDGFECNLRLKESQITANIPVIMLTAKSETTDKLTALFTGACEYITKPFKSQELLEAINRLLKTVESSDPEE